MFVPDQRPAGGSATCRVTVCGDPSVLAQTVRHFEEQGWRLRQVVLLDPGRWSVGFETPD